MIVHIVPAPFKHCQGVVGGAERYAFELARNMAELTPVSLVSFGDKSQEEHFGNLRQRIIGHPWRIRGQRSNPFSFRLFRELKNASIVHCHQQHIFASSMAALYCRLTGKKVFVSDLGGGGWDISGYTSTDRWYHGHLHISEYSRRVFGHQGKPWAHVILGGVDTEKFAPNQSVNKDGSILYVGRILPHKGIDNLIQALPKDLKLEILGQPYDQRYFNDLQALGKGRQVVFRHGCSDSQLIEAYNRAMCVVLPSVYRDCYGQETKVPELLGQTLIEGMACGLPTICTNVASLPEVVDHGVTGFVVPPNDPSAIKEKLLWFRDHPDDARRMGTAGRQRVMQKFTWPAVARRCLEIYGVHSGALRA